MNANAAASTGLSVGRGRSGGGGGGEQPACQAPVTHMSACHTLILSRPLLYVKHPAGLTCTLPRLWQRYYFTRSALTDSENTCGGRVAG